MADKRIPPQTTDSTFYLLAVLGGLSLIFIIAGVANIRPIIHVFEWLSVVL